MPLIEKSYGGQARNGREEYSDGVLSTCSGPARQLIEASSCDRPITKRRAQTASLNPRSSENSELRPVVASLAAVSHCRGVLWELRIVRAGFGGRRRNYGGVRATVAGRAAT